jgi:hypothetical protein
MQLKKISISELDDLLSSELFQQLKDKPISSFRAISYQQNPHAKTNDTVLYFLYDDDILIAYRTILPAKLTTSPDRFAWLSGNWVNPNYRRQGFSEQLLGEILNDWKHRLMFTNYAPASLQLYLKSNKFNPIYLEQGRRFYLYVKTKQLLGHRIKAIGYFSPALDFTIKLASQIKSRCHHSKATSAVKIVELNSPDADCLAMAEASKEDYLFERGQLELKWIFQYPWISTTDDSFLKNYSFSSYSKQFEYKTIKFICEDKLSGFMIVLITNGNMKLVYLKLPKELTQYATKHLIDLSIQYKIKTLTILNPDLAELIAGAANPFIYSKKIDHGIYASFPVSVNGKRIQDGDGDFIFT